MASLNVSLPKSLREYVERQVETEGYSTPSEYVRALIREDHKRMLAEKIEALLLEGIASGQTVELNRAYWKKKRSRLISNGRKPPK
ncbi:MAG: type II toxin-antitoxin system ParD family antitoxin [Acidobacteriia bacterium]|nr:type II toxin-antitoxin system ParD family antitoxin [Terriglobia bacterium]